MIRVLVVDDSRTLQAILTTILQSDPEVRVVGTASDGAEGVRKARELRPDLITMDIEMPVMDGLEAIRRIMDECPTPTVVVSAAARKPEANIAFRAIQAGALDVVAKPATCTPGDFEAIREQLLTKVRLMSEVRVIRRRYAANPGSSDAIPKIADPAAPATMPALRPVSLIAIGSSTGGPAVLSGLLKALPATITVPIVVVQHMSPGFTQGLVDWLQTGCRAPIRIVQDGEFAKPGNVYFAPEQIHLTFGTRGRFALIDAPPVSFVKPSATVFFQSIARFYGTDAAGIILTGMGDDGALGMRAMRDRGSLTIAQDEASCIVFGMPKAALALEAATQVQSPAEIARTLVALAAPRTPQAPDQTPAPPDPTRMERASRP